MQPTAIVTGGTQGIGMGIRHLLPEFGYHVIVADFDVEAGEKIAAEYAAKGSIEFMRTDIANEESVQNLVQKTLALGGRRGSFVAH